VITVMLPHRSLTPPTTSLVTWLAAGVCGALYVVAPFPRRYLPVPGEIWGSGVSGSCRCRDVAVTRGAMDSHDYPMGGGLPVHDVSPLREGWWGSFIDNWIEGF
jgi:hypothetical protein